MEQLPWNRHFCHLEDDPSGMSHHLGTDLDELFPQGRQRPVTHRAWQYGLPQVVSQIVGQHKKQQPDLVIDEVVAGKPRPSYGILPLLDPLFRRTSLIVKTHHPFCRPAQIGHDESDAREQLPPVPFHFGNHPAGDSSNSWPDTQSPYTAPEVFSGGLPTGRTVSGSIILFKVSLAGSRMAYKKPSSSRYS